MNADAFLLTGQDISGANMYTYCGNNPVKRIDTTGKFWSEICGFFQDVITGIGNAISQSAPAYAGLGSLTLVDGPCPLADTMAAIGALAVTAEAIGQGINQAAQAKEDEEAKAIAKSNRRKQQAYFPETPYEFNPRGLERKVILPVGTGKNGGIFKWEIPGTGIAIFEWDEDYKFGSHYHTMLPEHKNKHIILGHHKAGDEVPEPWNTLYFY